MQEKTRLQNGLLRKWILSNQKYVSELRKQIYKLGEKNVWLGNPNNLRLLSSQLIQKLLYWKTKIHFLSNSLRRTRGYNADSVPFLNKEENQEELPPILSVQDIDRLTKQQCQKYLRGYNTLFHSNETTRLKESCGMR